MTGMVVRSNIR